MTARLRRRSGLPLDGRPYCPRAAYRRGDGPVVTERKPLVVRGRL